MQRLNLASMDDGYISGADSDAKRLQNRQSRVAISDAEKKRAQANMLEQTVRRYTKRDQAGNTVTDHKSVLDELYRTDATLGKLYEDEVLADETAREDTRRKRNDDDVSFLANALSAVDEKGDQVQAAADYAAAIKLAEERGVKIDDADRVYSPGRVGFFKRKLIGAEELFKAGEKRNELEVKEGGLNTRHITPTGSSVVAANASIQNTNTREAGADGRWDRPSANAMLAALTPKGGAGGGGGTGGATKQGSIDLRTDPEFKRLRGINFEELIADTGSAMELLKSPAVKTGPGTGVNIGIDRLGLAADNVLGKGKMNPATWFGRRFAPDGAEDRTAAAALIDKLATKAGIGALAGIGGNDTDRDFDRALSTTISNLRGKKYNLETLTLYQEFLKLGQAKQDYMVKWTDAAGSPFATINGKSMMAGWQEYSAGEQKRIARLAKANGVLGAAQDKANGPQLKNSPARGMPQVPANARLLRNQDGSFWFQDLKTGKTTRAK